MESARELTSPEIGDRLTYAVQHRDAAIERPETVVFQVDAALSAVDGLAWLSGRRDAADSSRLALLQRDAADQRWGWVDLTRARLKLLRPRRAEINELGAAYLQALAPGAADAVAALRRANIAVALSSDVAAEALFGVATALGVSPNELYAPRLRFDAIGAFVGCDLNTARADDEPDAAGVRPTSTTLRTLYVGSRRSAVFAPRASDAFVAFSAAAEQAVPADAVAAIASFRDLAPLVLR